MHISSFIDSEYRTWVACSECRRGGNGPDENKCTLGGHITEFDGLGCHSGIPIAPVIRELYCGSCHDEFRDDKFAKKS